MYIGTRLSPLHAPVSPIFVSSPPPLPSPPSPVLINILSALWECINVTHDVIIPLFSNVTDDDTISHLCICRCICVDVCLCVLWR